MDKRLTPGEKIEKISKLEKIVESFGTTVKAKFFDVFWPAWSANGFGTLTKKDTELLIFGCLKQALESPGSRYNNYEWAKLLRLTPSKIKSYRLESHLRFGHLLGESITTDTKQFLENFSQIQSINVSSFEETGKVEEITVSFVVEDPVVQMEIENILKGFGSYMDFHRNREIITLRLIDFFRILTSEEQQKAIDKWVDDKAKDISETSKLKMRVQAKEFASQTEGAKIMIFADDLADFAGIKKLTDRLKIIFASQSERKK